MAYVGIVDQYVVGKDYYVVEVDGICLLLLVEIAHVDFGQPVGSPHIAHRRRLGIAHLLYDGHIVGGALALTYIVYGAAYGQLLEGQAHVGVDLLQHRALVFLVEQHEIGRVVEHVYVLFEHTHAEGVEGAYIGHVEVAEQGAYALLHLGSGLVGKCHAQHRPGVYAQQVGKIAVTRRQGTGLARTCSGKHAHRPLGGAHRVELSLVKAVEIIHLSEKNSVKARIV